jgi:transcriptional regulator of acetoin/glycerol metabolism
LDPDEALIGWQHLPDDLAEDLTCSLQKSSPKSVSNATHNLQDLSRSAIRLALVNCSGNISKAARQLGISRQTLYRKMQRLD